MSKSKDRVALDLTDKERGVLAALTSGKTSLEEMSADLPKGADPTSTARNALRRLLQRRLVKRKARGSYEITQAGAALLPASSQPASSQPEAAASPPAIASSGAARGAEHDHIYKVVYDAAARLLPELGTPSSSTHEVAYAWLITDSDTAIAKALGLSRGFVITRLKRLKASAEAKAIKRRCKCSDIRAVDARRLVHIAMGVEKVRRAVAAIIDEAGGL